MDDNSRIQLVIVRIGIGTSALKGGARFGPGCDHEWRSAEADNQQTRALEEVSSRRRHVQPIKGFFNMFRNIRSAHATTSLFELELRPAIAFAARLMAS